MKLHCLGTAGYHPSETRHTSAYFIPEANLLLDAGSGVFRLNRLLHQKEISVLLTHGHLDHTFGLTFFWDLLSVTPLERVNVYAQQHKITELREHLFHPSLFPVEPPIEWHAIDGTGDSFGIGNARCRWFPLEHPGGCVGYRLDWPEVSLAYVTDTTSYPDSTYWKNIQGVDWLIHECNFSDDYRDLAIKTGHSWTSAVLKNAAKHGVRRLILTHVNPLADVNDPIGLAKAMAHLGQETPPEIMIADDSTVIDLLSL